MTSSYINLVSSFNWAIVWTIIILVVIVKELVFRSGTRRSSSSQGQSGEAETAALWKGILGTTGAALVLALILVLALQFVMDGILPSTSALARRDSSLSSSTNTEETLVMQGETIFRTKGCLGCHTIVGVSEIGVIGPELTHVGSRDLIAQHIPYSRQNLRQWLTNPHQIKPGTQMPNMNLSEEELDAIVAYLDSLK
jgi:cytochrome c2